MQLTQDTLTLDNEREIVRRAVSNRVLTPGEGRARLINGSDFGERVEWVHECRERLAYIDEEGDLHALSTEAAFTLRKTPECVAVISIEDWTRLFIAQRPLCDRFKIRQLREGCVA